MNNVLLVAVLHSGHNLGEAERGRVQSKGWCCDALTRRQRMWSAGETKEDVADADRKGKTRRAGLKTSDGRAFVALTNPVCVALSHYLQTVEETYFLFI